MNVMSQITQGDRRYFGVAEALVVDNLDPAGEGRVRVQFPWFDENTTSEWCRVGQFYAGPKSAGAFFVPEIDAEVLVAFVHGDMRQPIIISSLYNGIDKPATTREQNKDEKQIQTRSGHRITLVDTEGEEKIVVVDKSGSNSIEFNTVDKSITIKSTDGKLSLAAKEIEINAEENLKIVANSIEESVKDSISTKAATIETVASGEIALKGSTINLN